MEESSLLVMESASACPNASFSISGKGFMSGLSSKSAQLSRGRTSTYVGTAPPLASAYQRKWTGHLVFSMASVILVIALRKSSPLPGRPRKVMTSENFEGIVESGGLLTLGKRA